MVWSAAHADEAVPQTVKSYEGKTLKLVWNDEFNGTGALNPADWKYEHGFVRNHEKQFYTEKRAENVYQKDGRLVIVGLREAYEENGIKADYTADGAYWALYIGEEYARTGVDTTPITDGQTYKFVYTKA